MEPIKMRSSLFGFKKKDVFDYISELSERNAVKLDAKESEAIQLRGEVYSIKQELENFKKENLVEVDRLQDLLNSKNKEIESYNQKLAEMQIGSKNVAYNGMDNSEETQKLKEQLQKVINEFEFFRVDNASEMSNLKAIIESKNAEIDNLNAGIESKSQEIAQFNAKIKELENSKNSELSNSAELAKTVAELEKLKQTHNNVVNSSTLEIEKFKGIIETKNNEIDRLKSRLEALEKDRDSVLAVMINAENEGKVIIEQAKMRSESILFQYDTQIADKRGELESITNDLKLLRSQLTNLTEKFATQIDDTIQEHVVDSK